MKVIFDPILNKLRKEDGSGPAVQNTTNITTSVVGGIYNQTVSIPGYPQGLYAITTTGIIPLFSMTKNSIWVDGTYGDDVSGLLHRRDKPVKTLERAMMLISPSGAGTYIIHIEIGTYNLTTALNLDVNKTYVFKGVDKKNVILNSAVIDHILFTPPGGVNRHSLYNLTLNLNALGKRISYRARYDVISNCEINLINGASVSLTSIRLCEDTTFKMLVGSMGNMSFDKTTFINCNFKAHSNLVFSAFLGKVYFKNCYLESLTSSIHRKALGVTLDLTFDGCILKSFKECIYIPGGSTYTPGKISFLNNNKLTTTDTAFEVLKFGYSPNRANFKLIVNGNLSLIQPDSSVQYAMSRVAAPIKFETLILGSIHTNKTIQPYEPNEIGYGINTVTAGNTYTLGFSAPYNLQDVTYTATAIDTPLTVVSALEAAILSQIPILGTSWNLWTKGDISKVVVNTTAGYVADIKILHDPSQIQGVKGLVTNVSWAVEFRKGKGFINELGGTVFENVPTELLSYLTDNTTANSLV